MVTLMALIAMLGAGVLNALNIVFASRNLHMATAFYGVLTAVGGLGGLFGVIFAGILYQTDIAQEDVECLCIAYWSGFRHLLFSELVCGWAHHLLPHVHPTGRHSCSLWATAPGRHAKGNDGARASGGGHKHVRGQPHLSSPGRVFGTISPGRSYSDGMWHLDRDGWSFWLGCYPGANNCTTRDTPSLRLKDLYYSYSS
jgi:hypothetical protein